MGDQTYVKLFLLALSLTLCRQEVQEVCFEGLECFSLGSPWTTLTRRLPPPQGPEVVKVVYQLYTWNNREIPYITSGSYCNFEDSSYDADKTTYVVFHGYGSFANESFMLETKDKLLKVDCNVILVDNGFNRDEYYSQAVSSIRVVSAQVAKSLKHLIDYAGASPLKFHLAGFSLGAHGASYVAKRIPGIGRLTGLDPAYFHFEGESPQVRIDKSDAVFVDVVHTNGNPTVPFIGFGINYPVGHADFYFNGGWNQPGCAIDVAQDVWKLTSKGHFFPALLKTFECNHVRSLHYFGEAFSGSNCTFWGIRRKPVSALLTVFSGGWLSKKISTQTKCTLDTCLPFGFNATLYPARGSFDVPTSYKPPYCVEQKDIDASMARQLEEYYQIIPVQ